MSQKESIQGKYGEFSSGIKFSDKQEDALVAVLSELENLAKTANIRIIDIRPQSQQGEVTHKEILVDLKTEGNMESHMKFIYDIENSLLLLRIKRFSLSAKADTGALEGRFSILKLYILE